MKITTYRQGRSVIAPYWSSMKHLRSCVCLAGLILFGSGSACLAQTAVSPGGVVNAASFVSGQPVAPGGIVAIFGTQLAGQLAQADTVPLATSLAGVSVSFNGMPAPLQFVSTGQINAQVPFEVNPAGNATLVVNNNGAMSAPAAVPVAQVAPGVFQFSNHAIAVNVTDPTSQRYATISAPSGSITGLTTFPAHVGDTLFLYATGLGPVDPPVPTGAGAGTDAVHNTVNKPTVLVGGVPAQVLFSGLTPQFPGIYQVNFVIPAVGTGDAVPLQIQMGSVTSPNTTTIAVQ
jgi:uncharacterized protein (TIGR03437 family)